MKKIPILNFFIAVLMAVLLFSCQSAPAQSEPIAPEMQQEETASIKVGAERTDVYLSTLKGKRLGMIVNQTSTIGQKSIVDGLLDLGVDIKKIFSPEHGFRGKADAGEKVNDGKDIKTELPIISLYGKNKKPTKEQFADLDLIVFDIQDVGARFYTYISTLHYVMQTAAEMNLPVLILDRPNPNGHFVDGPILEKEFSSFVGLHPVPIVHGMTVGEYGQMINGEGWLGDNLQCDLSVITCENYTHDTPYVLPIKPSPNLPNNLAIYLYPSLCLFEGTVVSIGRGTDKQFQVAGHPDSGIGFYDFTPEPKPGATNPKHNGKSCKGFDLSLMDHMDGYQWKNITLNLLIKFYEDAKDKENFFKPFFTKLAGTEKLQRQIENGKSEEEIRQTWQADLDAFNQTRSKYLLYK